MTRKIFKMNEKNLIKFITFGPIIAIPLIVALFFYMSIIHTQEIFDNSTKNLKQELILNEKDNTISKVKIAIEIFNNENTIIKDDSDVKINSDIKHNSIAILRNINKNKNDYFFIYDMDGNIILHSQNPELEGKNLFQSPDKNSRDVANKLLQSIKDENNNFASYKWINPKNGTLEEKMSYFEKIPNTNLMIGSGFYTKQIDAIADEKEKELQIINNGELNIMKAYSFVFVILSIFIALFISKKLQEKFTILKKDIEQKKDELILLNEELEQKVQTRTIELKCAYENMRTLANTDSLTQINNRFSFLNQFNAILDRYKQDNAEFSLIMLDIDFFKKINDTYGHNTGDEVLIEVTKLAKECLRESDIFGRVGGEEFMALLLNTPLQKAEDIAQRIRKKIDEHEFSFIKHVTVSIGVVTYNSNENSVDMLKRVDSALYKAKDSGRNKVCQM